MLFASNLTPMVNYLPDSITKEATSVWLTLISLLCLLEALRII